jgi:hypothetical protein
MWARIIYQTGYLIGKPDIEIEALGALQAKCESGTDI